MDPADAVRCADIGCDGVIVSNHGGRQFDQAPASLDVLPAIKAAVGDQLTVMLDSGVRRGADILIAMCLGARVLLLRPADPLRRGRRRMPGVKKAIDIFRSEIDLVMGQIGCQSLDQLGPDFLWPEDWQRNRWTGRGQSRPAPSLRRPPAGVPRRALPIQGKRGGPGWQD